MMYTTKIRKKFLAFIKYLKMNILIVYFSSVNPEYKIKKTLLE